MKKKMNKRRVKNMRNRNKKSIKTCVMMILKKVIESLDELLKTLPKDMVLELAYYDRVSTKEQRDNLRVRRQMVKRILLERYGKRITIKKCFSDICTGVSSGLSERTGLNVAISYAVKHDVPILIASLDRLVRADDYSERGHFCRLKKVDARRVDDSIPILVVSLCNLEMSPKKARGYLTKLGKDGNDSPGGRKKSTVKGARIQRFVTYFRIALKLHKQCYSLRIISRMIRGKYGEHIPFNTIGRWVKNKKKYREKYYMYKNKNR